MDMKQWLMKLQARRTELFRDAEKIVNLAEQEGRSLTEDERSRFDAKKKEIDDVDRDIERVTSLIGTPDPRRNSILPQVHDGGADYDRIIARTRSRGRVATLRNFQGKDGEELAYRTGMWFMATIYDRPWAKRWCHDNGIPVVYDAQGEDTNSKGGYLVPVEQENTIIDLREQFGLFRRFARIHAMASEHTVIPRRAGGLTAYPIGENQAITESDKTWSQVTLTARKWGALTRYSSEVSEDAIINIADDLSGEIAYAFASAEDDAGFNGDGTSAYHGIRGIRTKIIGLAGAVAAASAHNTFATIDAADLDKVTAIVPQYALPTSAWYCSQVGYQLVFSRLSRAAGGNTKMDLAGKQVDSYLGYPILISQKLPLVQTALTGVAMLLFGDIRLACTMGTRRGITIAVSDQRYFENDQLAIRGTERFDINAHDLGDATTAGPVAALIGTA